MRHAPVDRLLAAAAIVAFVLALAPALAPWALSGHSAALDLQREEAYHRAVLGGDLLPRWLPDLYGGYGSPIFGFYAPLPYALVEALRWLGAGGLWAPKLALAALWLVGALGARALAGRCFGREAGWVAFGAWALAPYLLLDLYVRSAFGEIAGLALLPWSFAALLAADAERPARGLARGGFAFALLVLAHNIVALLAAPALGLVALAGRGRTRWVRLVALAAGLALSAWFWLPALVEKDLVFAEESLTRGQFAVENNLLAPAALLPWKAQLAFPAHGGVPFGFRLGALLWLAVALSPWAVRRLEGRARVAALAALAALALLLLLCLETSGALWRALPLVRFVQFPFRLFGPASLAALLLAAAAVAACPERWRTAAGGAALLVAGLGATGVLDQARYGLVDTRTLETRVYRRDEIGAALAADPRLVDPLDFVKAALDSRVMYSGTSRDDYLPRTVERKPAPLRDAVAVVPPAAGAPVAVLDEARRGTRLRATVEVSAPAPLVFHQFWFPGWRVRVDGAPREVRPEPAFGRIEVDLDPGDRSVEVTLGVTPLRRAANGSSLATLVALLTAAAIERGRRKRPAAP